MGQSELDRKQSDLNPWYLEARAKIYSTSSTSSSTATASSTNSRSIAGSGPGPRTKQADWDAKRKRALDPLSDMARYEEASKKYRASLTRPTLPPPSQSSAAVSQSQPRGIAKQEPSDSFSSRASAAASSSQSNSLSLSAHSSASASGSRSIEQLRAERMAREANERARAEALMARVNAARAGVPLQYSAASEFSAAASDEREHRYNSQFNPDIARQNRPRDQFA